MKDLVIVDSVTGLGPEARGSVVIGGSHCGLFSAYMAAAARVTGVILNDASVGKDSAGIGGLAYLNRLGVPAAAADYRESRIGDGVDCARRGIVRFINACAQSIGIEQGMAARAAAALISSCVDLEPAPKPAPVPQESRTELEVLDGSRPIVLVDSISLVRPGDADAVMVSGSHGGLLGGRPETAVKEDVFATVYNDAGGGIDGAGFTRLPALDRRGIAAATVDASTARIGDARSTYEDGVVSRINETAECFGGRVGMTAFEFVSLLSKISRGRSE